MSDASRTLTAEFCGDPGPGRSALDGWQQIGVDYFRDPDDASGVQKRRARYGSERGVGKRKYEKRGMNGCTR